MNTIINEKMRELHDLAKQLFDNSLSSSVGTPYLQLFDSKKFRVSQKRHIIYTKICRSYGTQTFFYNLCYKHFAPNGAKINKFRSLFWKAVYCNFCGLNLDRISKKGVCDWREDVELFGCELAANEIEDNTKECFSRSSFAAFVQISGSNPLPDHLTEYRFLNQSCLAFHTDRHKFT